MSKPDHAGGPVDRIELLGAIIDDERVRLIHIKTARHILKRYYQKHGNARASVSFLQQATGLTRGSVASATEDLVAWGYFTRVMGSGKRPSEYHPNFSVLQSPDTTSVLPLQDETKSSVLQPQDEIVLRPQDAKSPSVLQPREQTLLLGSATWVRFLADKRRSPDAGNRRQTYGPVSGWRAGWRRHFKTDRGVGEAWIQSVGPQQSSGAGRQRARGRPVR